MINSPSQIVSLGSELIKLTLGEEITDKENASVLITEQPFSVPDTVTVSVFSSVSIRIELIGELGPKLIPPKKNS